MRDKVLELCSGNEEAEKLIFSLWNLFVVWDDAVDGDKKTSQENINSAFMWALFGFNESVFYRQNEAAIRPAMFTCIGKWIKANEFEKSGVRTKVIDAYAMRTSPYELFSTIVFLASGSKKQLEAIEYFYTMNPADTLESYLAEHLGE